MKSSKPGATDPEVIAKGLIRARKLQLITQEQLATRSLVSESSIFRAEKAKPVRLSTLKKIAKGLNVTFDSVQLPQVEGTEVIIHRIAAANWYAESDHRVRLPEDHLVRYQDAEERHRLGRLGFVPAFVVPPAGIMKNGPGVVLLELFGELHGDFNSRFYQHAVIFAVRGRTKLRVGNESIEISEGDWVSFPSAELEMMDSAEELSSSRNPALVLWIGTERLPNKAKGAEESREKPSVEAKNKVMKLSKPGGIDLRIVAENLVNARSLQGITQAQLAAKANVSEPTVFRAEKAQSVRLSTLEKIAVRGLKIEIDTLLVPKLGAIEGTKIVIHRASDEIWYPLPYTTRPAVPDDRLLRYQAQGERLRLGRLGFVCGFMAPTTIFVKDGPGLVLIELFGNIKCPFNAQFYKDAVIYVIRGRVRMKIGTKVIDISEGDWVGCPTADVVLLGSVDEPGTSKSPATVLWIGANRRSQKPRRQK